MTLLTFNKGPDGRLIPKPGRLNELMEQCKIVLCVIDGEPSGNDALNFQQDYVKEKRVWVNHSTKVNIDDPRLGFNWIENDIEPNQEEIFLGRISEDTTGASHFCHSGKFVYQAVCLFFKLPFFNPKIILASGNIDGVKLFQRKN